jgi:dTMP kinase
MRGKFITLEGGEGTGKSTQIRRLAERLRDRGLEVVTTREPGGSQGAEEIRKLLVEGAVGRWTPLTEALLLFAARSDHLARTINPARARGAWVISDRFADSTRAYQSGAQGVGREAVRTLRDMVVGDDGPDLTLILDLPVEEGLRRALARGGDETRYERMGLAFHHALRAAYLEIAAEEPKRCMVIDATGTESDVAARLYAAVSDRLGL